MFEKFSERARNVMALANQEAQRFNHEYVGTEHILLGLVKEGSGFGANVLKNLGLDLGKVRQEVEKLVKAGPDMITMGKLPLAPRANKVIKYAVDEAHAFNHDWVGTEHILMGLLRERDGVAGSVLIMLGLNTEDARQEITNLLGAEMPAEPKENQQAGVVDLQYRCRRCGKVFTKTPPVLRCNADAVLLIACGGDNPNPRDSSAERAAKLVQPVVLHSCPKRKGVGVADLVGHL